MKPPVCPIHRDLLDEPMKHTGTRDGRDYWRCPNAGREQPQCSAEINRPAHDPHASPYRQHSAGEDL